MTNAVGEDRGNSYSYESRNCGTHIPITNNPSVQKNFGNDAIHVIQHDSAHGIMLGFECVQDAAE